MANELARHLRRNATAAERKLWYRLRTLKSVDAKFRRQVPIDHYIVDFACLSKGIIIEVDGATHGAEAEIEKDYVRQRYLEAQGFRVLRFTNLEIAENIDGVMDEIIRVVSRERTPTPDPSPQGGGE